VQIGDHCWITSHVCLSGDVVIEPFCVIGVNASISNNVTVAERCFIGANALISKNTEPNGLFKMWYISATEWVQEEQDSKPKHYYTVKYAQSQDGMAWKTSPHLCIDYQDEEYAIARPVIFKEGDSYSMWFTYRGGTDTYRVGTASSSDGIHWQRDDKLALEVSDDGWDSEMICYAHPLRYKGSFYALYNGNGYGATGIGLALREGADGG